MTLARRVAWNTIAQSGARVLTLALSLLTTALLTRHLGVDGYGVFVTVTVYVTFFATFFDLGVSQYLSRELAADQSSQDRQFREALGLRALLAIPIALVALGVALLIYHDPGDADIRRGIAIALPLVVLLGLASVGSALFQARLMLDRVALAEICGQLVGAGAIVAAVVTDRGVGTVIAAVVLGATVNTLVIFGLARRATSLRPILDVAAWRRLLSRALPLGLAVMVATVYFRADAILLSILKGPAAVGIYGIAYRLLEASIAFAGFFVASVFPLLTQTARSGDAEGFRGISQRSFDVLALAAIPLVFGTIALAPELIRILSGSGFEDAVTPLRIVIVGGGLMFISTLLGLMLIALDEQVSVLWASVAVLVLNVALNLVLIPRYSYTAAAAVATGSEVLSLILFSWLVRARADFVPRLGTTAKGMVAGLAMFGVLEVLPTGFVVSCLLGVATYVAALWLVRGHAALELRQLLGGSGR